MNFPSSLHRVLAHTPKAETVLPDQETEEPEKKSAPTAPPEIHMEDLEARHKRETRELEGAARAARKAAGKNKTKIEEVNVAADQAMAQLRTVHESEVLGLQLRDESDDHSSSTGHVVPDTCRALIAGVKDLLTSKSVKEDAAQELRIDTADGHAYPLESFLEVYGEDGPLRWATAPPASSTTYDTTSSNRSFVVMGSKKGGFPVSVESRSRGKTVTVIHNVNGDVEALLAELKKSLGGGGVVRDGNVEVQGDHAERVEVLLLKLGCVKGVSHTNIAAALPAAKPVKAVKSIASLDRKASHPSRSSLHEAHPSHSSLP